MKEPSRVLKTLYPATVAYPLEPLQGCYALMGASQLLLGTGHPYGPWRRPVELLQELTCPENDREQRLHGNAEGLFLP